MNKHVNVVSGMVWLGSCYNYWMSLLQRFLGNDEVEGDDSILYNILLHELVHALGFSRYRLTE